ncbi:MAG: FAD-linked oxidase C-terminal domain-containing protein, partial [bacterium]
GIPIARAELLDSTTLRAINAYSKTQLPEQPTLFLEFHGSPASVEEQAQTVQEIAQEHQGAEFQWATQPEQRSKLWQARHDAYFAALQLKPGCRSVTTDVCVPISRLAEVIEVTQQILSGSNLPAPLFGHVGDGNFHCAILVNPENAAELAEAERLNEAIVQTALGHDGTCTGEHGVGLHKMAFLAQEHGTDMLDLMRTIKHAFDPLGILNPGKIVSPA